MTFNLVHHVKARTRSLQLDKSVLAMTTSAVPTDPSGSSAESNQRTCSLPAGQENTASSSIPPASHAIHHFRSMLEVEEPPKLDPLKQMSFELYASPTGTLDLPKDPEQSKHKAVVRFSGMPNYAVKQSPKDATSQQCPSLCIHTEHTYLSHHMLISC